jgi:RsiW-degrading membrane proteinase PrsW (M82 family)
VCGEENEKKLVMSNRLLRSSQASDPLGGGEEPSTTYRSFSSIIPPTVTTTTTSTHISTRRRGHTDDNETHGGGAEVNTSYRGFSTSVGDFMSSSAHHRTDCCAMTCCGVLQSDRDRFLLTGVTPPGPMKRVTVHVVLPLLIFMCAGLGAIHIRNPVINQGVSTLLILFMLAYIMVQCYKGRSKRIKVRKDLLYTKYQIQQNRNQESLSLMLDHERPDEDDRNAAYYMGQTPWDFACAHPCCWIGCYADDRPASRAAESNSSNGNNDDLCTCLYNWAYPSPICGMHILCCGMQALAQEARELESAILPTAYRRIDYITMQPVMDYYPAIYKAKWSNNNRTSRNAALNQAAAGNTSDASALTQPIHESQAVVCASMATFPPHMSLLSYRLLMWLSTFILVSLTWSLIGPMYWKYVVRDHVRHKTFTLVDFYILLLVFGQSFLVVVIISWLCNRHKYSELSLDAIVKFFASGFLLSTSLAVFWEFLLGLILRVIVAIGLAIAGVDEVSDQNRSTSTWMGYAVDLIPHPPRALWGMPISASSSSQDFMESFGRDHPAIYTLYIAVATFIMAAFVEEMCKYFGYRMCDEHPDFVSKREMAKASQIIFADTEEDVEQHHRHHMGDDAFSLQRQSFQAHGAAITLAMICVAMGFTCCENLVYVFVYSGSSPQMEMYVLVFRSLFPVHAICAAIQSVGVCQREIETTQPRMKLGRILLPAILFHGAYDFFLVWINFLANRTRGVNATDDDTAAPDVDGSQVAAVLSFIVSVGLMVTALFYYLIEARKQRKRLAAMDQRASEERSRLI